MKRPSKHALLDAALVVYLLPLLVVVAAWTVLSAFVGGTWNVLRSIGR